MKKVLNNYALHNAFMIHKEETAYKTPVNAVLDATGNETNAAEAEVALTYTSAG